MSDRMMARPITERPRNNEPQAYKKSLLNTIRRQFNKLPKTARAVILATTVLTGAGAAHHATGIDVPGPIPVGGIVDKVGSTAVDKVLGISQKNEFDKNESGIQMQAGNASDGTIFVSSDFVNRSVDQSGAHIVTFGGANVTPDATGYNLQDPALNLNTGRQTLPDETPQLVPSVSQPEAVVPVTYADGTSGYLFIPINDPRGEVGTGNPDAIIAKKATTIATIEYNGTVDKPDNNGILPTSAQNLSRATATTAPAPTLQP